GAETIRQGVVMVTQHQASAPADLDAFISAQTDYTDRSQAYAYSDSGPARAVPTQTVSSVREVHLTGQQQLAAPIAGAIDHAVNAVNTALLSAVSRFHMPLCLISGDATRNYARVLQAKGPGGKFVKEEAAGFRRHVRNILLRVLAAAAGRGELPAGALDEVDLVVTPQRTTEQRNPMLETNRNQTLFQ